MAHHTDLLTSRWVFRSVYQMLSLNGPHAVLLKCGKLLTVVELIGSTDITMPRTII